MRLARENHARNIIKGLIPSPESPRHSVDFTLGDVFSDSLLDAAEAQGDEAGDRQQPQKRRRWDVLVCNPPYVSRWAFAHQSARSVRNYEPMLAQVPAVAYGGGAVRHEDVFYARLLDIAVRLRPRVLLFEVGDLGQALRVAEMALRHEDLASLWSSVDVEVWRDWPDAAPEEDEKISAKVSEGSREVHIRGSGHGRSVFIQCS